MRILFIGDVVGKPGRGLVERWIPRLKTQHQPDAIIVNGENAANNGRGITPKIADFFRQCGVHMITTGNHVWGQKDSNLFATEQTLVLRPANFPSACPGKGIGFFEVAGKTIAVINIQGRVFMHEHLDCPFKTLDSLIAYAQSKTSIIFVDFHAEATSEKISFGMYADGRASVVVGTHTHIQTADEMILPHGTAYITDVGATCALYSSIGMRYQMVINRFITQMPQKLEVETAPPYALSAVLVDVDAQSGRALAIERIRVVDDTPLVDSDES